MHYHLSHFVHRLLNHSTLLSSLLQLYDPTTLVRTFPRMTKCPFNFYGPNGELFKEEYLCILPQNVLNEKIFIGMWFLFIILATITAVEVRKKERLQRSFSLAIWLLDTPRLPKGSNSDKSHSLHLKEEGEVDTGVFPHL